MNEQWEACRRSSKSTVEQGNISVVFEISPSYRYKKTIIRSMDNGKFENRMEINVQYVVRMFEFYTLTS